LADLRVLGVQGGRGRVAKTRAAGLDQTADAGAQHQDSALSADHAAQHDVTADVGL
jgi:hypothetical protein